MTRPGPSGERGRKGRPRLFSFFGFFLLSSPFSLFIGCVDVYCFIFFLSFLLFYHWHCYKYFFDFLFSWVLLFSPPSYFLFLDREVFANISPTVYLQTYPFYQGITTYLHTKKETKSKLKTFQTQKAFFVNLCGN